MRGDLDELLRPEAIQDVQRQLQHTAPTTLARTVEELVAATYLIMDGRRMIPDHGDLVSKNYSYIAVGSMLMGPTHS